MAVPPPKILLVWVSTFHWSAAEKFLHARLYPPKSNVKNGELLAVPVTSLYDHGQLMDHTPLLEKRVVPGGISVHPATALKLRYHRWADIEDQAQRQ